MPSRREDAERDLSDLAQRREHWAVKRPLGVQEDTKWLDEHLVARKISTSRKAPNSQEGFDQQGSAE